MTETGGRRVVSLIPFDYALIATLLLLLVPAFHMAHLPLQIDFLEMAGAYWGGTALQTTFFAILLAIIGLPLEETLLPFLRRCRKQKVRILHQSHWPPSCSHSSACGSRSSSLSMQWR